MSQKDIQEQFGFVARGCAPQQRWKSEDVRAMLRNRILNNSTVNVCQISKQTGTPETTIRFWRENILRTIHQERLLAAAGNALPVVLYPPQPQWALPSTASASQVLLQARQPQALAPSRPAPQVIFLSRARAVTQRLEPLSNLKPHRSPCNPGPVQLPAASFGTL